MISLGNDITIGKGERTIQRHLKYANSRKQNIYNGHLPVKVES